MVLKKIVVLIVLFITISFMFSCNEINLNINVSSDFEAGGIILKENIGDSLLICKTKHWVKNDSIGNQFYWFYFKMNNVKDKKINVRLENLEGTYRRKPHLIYRGLPFPVFSYNQIDWERIKEIHYDDEQKAFEFSHEYKSDSVWIAYAHPYTYNQANLLVKRASASALVDIDTISKSREDRNIYLLKISDSEALGIKKKNIYFQALQHSGEMAGGYFIEGLVSYLLDRTQSQELLRHYNFFIVPVVNPDGLIHGISRYNLNMSDLNSQWFENIDNIEEPEIKGIRSWLQTWYNEGNRIDHVFDIHCWGQQNQNLYITNTDTMYHKMIDKFTPFKRIPAKNIHNANWYFQNIMNTTATTVELSQKNGLKTDLYTISDFRNIGENFAKAFYFQIKEY